jgi:hypothetical protein
MVLGEAAERTRKIEKHLSEREGFRPRTSPVLLPKKNVGGSPGRSTQQPQVGVQSVGRRIGEAVFVSRDTNTRLAGKRTMQEALDAST